MSQPDPAGELILEVTRASRTDRSPRQFITAEMLAYYQRCEAELMTIKGASACAQSIATPEVMPAHP